MSTNPFNLYEKVEGDTTVERMSTTIIGYDGEKLKWEKHEEVEWLTLDGILNQVMDSYKGTEMEGKVPFLRVWYESGLWGVIFEIGNYSLTDKQWIVHGITKGYA